jgi:hypothetical protein
MNWRFLVSISDEEIPGTLAPQASQTPADIPVEFWEVISKVK